MSADARHGGSSTVRVSRVIQASAAEIFDVLSDPNRQLDMDGSGMLRGAVTGGRVRGVGDVFTMRMHARHLGDYEMDNHVVAFEQDRLIGWQPHNGRSHPRQGESWGHTWTFELTPEGSNATRVIEIYDCSGAPADERAEMDNGQIWTDAMASTLERLAGIVEHSARP